MSYIVYKNYSIVYKLSYIIFCIRYLINYTRYFIKYLYNHLISGVDCYLVNVLRRQLHGNSSQEQINIAINTIDTEIMDRLGRIAEYLDGHLKVKGTLKKCYICHATYGLL